MKDQTTCQTCGGPATRPRAEWQSLRPAMFCDGCNKIVGRCARAVQEDPQTVTDDDCGGHWTHAFERPMDPECEWCGHPETEHPNGTWTDPRAALEGGTPAPSLTPDGTKEFVAFAVEFLALSLGEDHATIRVGRRIVAALSSEPSVPVESTP